MDFVFGVSCFYAKIQCLSAVVFSVEHFVINMARMFYSIL